MSLASIHALVIAGVLGSNAGTAEALASLGGNSDDSIFNDSAPLVAGRWRLSSCIEGVRGGTFGVLEELNGLEMEERSGGGSKPKKDFIRLLRLLLLLVVETLSLSSLGNGEDGGSGGGMGGGGSGGGMVGMLFCLSTLLALPLTLLGNGGVDPSSSKPPSLAMELSLLATLLMGGSVGGASDMALFRFSVPSLVCGRKSPSRLGWADRAGLGGSSKSKVICKGETRGFPLPLDAVLWWGNCGGGSGRGRGDVCCCCCCCCCWRGWSGGWTAMPSPFCVARSCCLRFFENIMNPLPNACAVVGREQVLVWRFPYACPWMSRALFHITCELFPAQYFGVRQ